MARSPRSSTAASEPAEHRPSPEEVAREAYLIYLAHGAEDGHDQEHWYEAERRLVSNDNGSSPEHEAGPS